MSSSIHDKLNRVRKPRVHITYEVETEGAQIQRELPFVVGVMGDFSGDPTTPLKPLADRKFIQIDRDNFNDVMANMAPGLKLKVDNKLTDDGSEMAVDLKFNSMDDFEPAAVAEQVPPLRRCSRPATSCATCMSKVDRSEELESLLEQVLQLGEGPQVAVRRTRHQEGGGMSEMADAKSAPEAAATTTEAAPGLARSDPHHDQADRARPRAGPRQDARRAGAGRHGHLRPQRHADDRQGRSRRSTPRCPQQLNAIMHHPEFQKLEGTWRGLHYLVMNSETSTSLKLRVLNITKRELCHDLDRAVEFDQSQLFKKIYENEFGTPGGEPYGALIGDYEFTQPPGRHRDSAADVQRRGRRLRAVHLRGRRRHVRLRQLDRAVQAARPGEDLRHGRIHQVAERSATPRTRASSPW